jgi:hypothetical protein
MTKKESKRRPWTPGHVRTLKSLARKKKHAASIAKALKRTEGVQRARRRSVWDCRSTRVLEFHTNKALPCAGLFWNFRRGDNQGR